MGHTIYSTEFVLLGLCDRLELYRLTVADGEPPKHTRGGMRSWPHRSRFGLPGSVPPKRRAGIRTQRRLRESSRTKPIPQVAPKTRSSISVPQNRAKRPAHSKIFHKDLFPSPGIPFFPDLPPVLNYPRMARHIPHFRYRGIPCSQ